MERLWPNDGLVLVSALIPGAACLPGSHIASAAAGRARSAGCGRGWRLFGEAPQQPDPEAEEQRPRRAIQPAPRGRRAAAGDARGAAISTARTVSTPAAAARGTSICTQGGLRRIDEQRHEGEEEQPDLWVQ
jgi:hypothetical protein